MIPQLALRNNSFYETKDPELWGATYRKCISGSAILRHIFPGKRNTYNCTVFSNNKCTDEILISDVNSHKTSLAIIYMCLKMYCYKCTC